MTTQFNMDGIDSLFFDHRLQNKAKIEPLHFSQKHNQHFLELPTLDDFSSTQSLKADLENFQPSQIIHKDSRRENQKVLGCSQARNSSQVGAHMRQFNADYKHPDSYSANKTFARPLIRNTVPIKPASQSWKPPNKLVVQLRDDSCDGEEDLFTDSSPCISTAPVLRASAFCTPQILSIPDVGSGRTGRVSKLRSVEEIQRYREVFSFPYFNIVQSLVLDDVLYTDKPMVVCAPTGSGKTAIFELAILRLLMKAATQNIGRGKIVYMAPLKALCSERYLDWQEKFEPFGLKCKELTGDTELDDYFQLQDVNIVTTTPEKWDSMTRKWRDNKSLVQLVRLFLIDEVHVLHDDTRGATMEAVISRMKTVQSAMSWSDNNSASMRFIAVSATIPNIEDIADWLGDNDKTAVYHKLGDDYRPVRLRKVVLGFSCSDETSDFKFDITLNYKMSHIIETYSEGKPALVFCSTRKSTQQASGILVKDARFILNSQHKQTLVRASKLLKDSKLRDSVLAGVGYHHAGLDLEDRKAIEHLFAKSELPVLFATSTLAMGVNLPAHLVVIKSTSSYVMGAVQEYSDTQVLQMIGRAGRPQFDTSATAVIMTKSCNKHKYESLIGGTQFIESSLHKHLIEHLNAEIVLNTINDVTVALEWMRSTLLYIRVMKNPRHYNMPAGLTKDQVEKRLQDLCISKLNCLTDIDLIKMDEDHFDIKPTALRGDSKGLMQLTMVSSSREFSDIQLRINERKTLNTLNKDKNRMTIRFPMAGKIKSKDMKVNCLIQAQLGCLSVQDFALAQDISKIFRAGQRLTRCLVEFLWEKNQFQSLLSSVLIRKCFKARLWENSKNVTKQLEGIGPTLSNALVNAGVSTFQKIEETNPRELELIVNRHPPFGNQLREAVAKLPKYELSIEQVARYNPTTAEIAVTICLANQQQLIANSADHKHSCVLLIGDLDNKVVLKARISDAILLKVGCWQRKLEVNRSSKGTDLDIHLISEDWVGLDVQSQYTPYYTGLKTVKGANIPSNEDNLEQYIEYTPPNMVDDFDTPLSDRDQYPPGEGDRRCCFHRCLNKSVCGHECCKIGIPVSNKHSMKRAFTSSKLDLRPYSGPVNQYVDNLKTKLQRMPNTPNVKRLKMNFREKPGQPYSPSDQINFTPSSRRTPSLVKQQTPAIGKTPRGWDDLDLYQRYREDCQATEDDIDNTLPNLFMHERKSFPTPAVERISINEWDSDEASEYGDFNCGLRITANPHSPALRDAYTTDNFQDVGDSMDFTSGPCEMPDLHRHQYYQTADKKKPPACQPEPCERVRHHRQQVGIPSCLKTPTESLRRFQFQRKLPSKLPGMSSHSFRLPPRKLPDEQQQTNSVRAPPQQHIQGQVFAWPATGKRDKPTGSSTSVKLELSAPQPDHSQDSQSYSPTIPRISEFVMAKQVYDRQKEPNHQRLPVRHKLPVKSSPTFSSDGDDNVMAGHLDSFEKQLETNPPRPSSPHDMQSVPLHIKGTGIEEKEPVIDLVQEKPKESHAEYQKLELPLLNNARTVSLLQRRHSFFTKGSLDKSDEKGGAMDTFGSIFDGIF